MKNARSFLCLTLTIIAMFGIFKSKAKATLSPVEKAIAKAQIAPTPVTDVQLLVAEIHESFNTEVAKLLAEAKIMKSTATDYDVLIKKSERLKKLGFSNTSECIKANGEIERLLVLVKENKNKETIIEVINFCSMHYPNYKFITEESVQKICAKYGLVYTIVSKYKGIVPDANLLAIENFKLKDDHQGWCVHNRYDVTWERIYSERKAAALSFRKPVKAQFEIAAPVKDFDLSSEERKKIKNGKVNLDIPDPIVLSPFMFKEQKYYLVVTAWGLEASDESVVNQKFN